MADRAFGTTDIAGGDVPLTASIAEVLEDKASRGDQYAEDWVDTDEDLTGDAGSGFAAAVGSFFRRHPVIALAGTVAIGYAIAQLRRRS
jgi:hypothetical protein